METTLPPHPTKKSFARFIPPIARYVLGLPLLVFGLNMFFHFIPEPKEPIAPAAAAFAGALFAPGSYMTALLGVTFLLVGALLATNRFVPLALALFAPFIVNSVLFHASLERTGLPMSLVFLVLELYLVRAYRSAYRPMLAARVTPG